MKDVFGLDATSTKFWIFDEGDQHPISLLKTCKSDEGCWTTTQDRSISRKKRVNPFVCVFLPSIIYFLWNFFFLFCFDRWGRHIRVQLIDASPYLGLCAPLFSYLNFPIVDVTRREKEPAAHIYLMMPSVHLTVKFWGGKKKKVSYLFS